MKIQRRFGLRILLFIGFVCLFGSGELHAMWLVPQALKTNPQISKEYTVDVLRDLGQLSPTTTVENLNSAYTAMQKHWDLSKKEYQIVPFGIEPPYTTQDWPPLPLGTAKPLERLYTTSNEIYNGFLQSNYSEMNELFPIAIQSTSELINFREKILQDKNELKKRIKKNKNEFSPKQYQKVFKLWTSIDNIVKRNPAFEQSIKDSHFLSENTHTLKQKLEEQELLQRKDELKKNELTRELEKNKTLSTMLKEEKPEYANLLKKSQNMLLQYKKMPLKPEEIKNIVSFFSSFRQSVETLSKIDSMLKNIQDKTPHIYDQRFDKDIKPRLEEGEDLKKNLINQLANPNAREAKKLEISLQSLFKKIDMIKDQYLAQLPSESGAISSALQRYVTAPITYTAITTGEKLTEGLQSKIEEAQRKTETILKKAEGVIEQSKTATKEVIEKAETTTKEAIEKTKAEILGGSFKALEKKPKNISEQETFKKTENLKSEYSDLIKLSEQDAVAKKSEMLDNINNFIATRFTKLSEENRQRVIELDKDLKSLIQDRLSEDKQLFDQKINELHNLTLLETEKEMHLSARVEETKKNIEKTKATIQELEDRLAYEQAKEKTADKGKEEEEEEEGVELSPSSKAGEKANATFQELEDKGVDLGYLQEKLEQLQQEHLTQKIHDEQESTKNLKSKLAKREEVSQIYLEYIDKAIDNLDDESHRQLSMEDSTTVANFFPLFRKAIEKFVNIDDELEKIKRSELQTSEGSHVFSSFNMERNRLRRELSTQLENMNPENINILNDKLDSLLNNVQKITNPGMLAQVKEQAALAGEAAAEPIKKQLKSTEKIASDARSTGKYYAIGAAATLLALPFVSRGLEYSLGYGVPALGSALTDYISGLLYFKK